MHLPATFKPLLKLPLERLNQDMLDEYTARNNAALVELVETHGVQVRKLPDDVLAEIASVCPPMV